MRDGPDGDILVFCSGEREIRDAADAIGGLDWRALTRRNVEILPLFARLSAHEQHRVFARHSGLRIVLATNVAETSLTVPGIRSVVDPGFARISRWSARTKVQRLPIEPISPGFGQSARRTLRSRRPGGLHPALRRGGLRGRPAFTEPEILRTNLAAVILQMAHARLGDITRFPFVEPPDSAQISDGLRLLTELGAIESGRPGRGSSPARQPADAGLDGRSSTGDDNARRAGVSTSSRRRSRSGLGRPCPWTWSRRRRPADPGRPPTGQAAGRSAPGPDADRGRAAGVPAGGAGGGRRA